MTRIAWVVSSHGYGHATRTAAVLGALVATGDPVEVVVCGRSPARIFAGLPGVTCRRTLTDVGFVQKDAVEEDHSATAAAATAYLTNLPRRAARLARFLSEWRADLVVADIAALGLVAAERAAIPSVLLESFTWDWLYARTGFPALEQLVGAFESRFALAHRRIRCEPFCGGANLGGLVVGPVVRPLKLPAAQVRARLGLDADDFVVLATMGGFGWSWQAAHFRRLPTTTAAGRRLVVVAPGAPAEVGRLPQVRVIPHHHGLHHPDLVAASDAVVGKLGYGTVVEVAQAGARFVWVRRPGFPESAELERWVRSHCVGIGLDPVALADGSWAEAVAAVAQLPAPAVIPTEGAAQAAREILATLA